MFQVFGGSPHLKKKRKKKEVIKLGQLRLVKQSECASVHAVTVVQILQKKLHSTTLWLHREEKEVMKMGQSSRNC